MTKKKSAAPAKSAQEGVYGAAPYDRNALYAEVMLRGIKAEMPDVAYFTREDLLQLRCFSMVATITRYGYVCAAVRHAIERSWMVPVSRTELILTGRKREFLKSNLHSSEYFPSIIKRLPDGEFSAMSLVDTWDSDHHLTYNAKRMIVRDATKHMLSRGIIERIDFDLYRRKEG